MRLIHQAIDKPRLVILGAVLLCAAGLAAVFTLPKERTPRVKLPVIVVAVPNAGASAATNETEILREIEDESRTLDGLRSHQFVVSQAVHGATVVQFVFDHSRSVEDAKRDVESLINRIKSRFPREAQQDPGPIVNDIGYDNWPIIQVFIAGGSDGMQRRRIAERLETEIESVNGVAGVDIFGGLEREVHIEVDPNLMVLYGFSYAQVEGAIRRANMEVPSGTIEAGASDQRVRTASRLQNIEDLRQIPVGVSEGKPVMLADVARVSMSSKTRKSIARYGGEDAVVLLVRPKTDVDVLAAANGAQAAVEKFIAEGGAENTRVGTVRSQAREIHYMVEQLGSNALWGTVLVIIMLWFAFGWRNATLIAISFPFCILGTAAALWVAKMTINPDLAINNMTLFAIIVVVGEVADGAIIVGENIYRHRELGKSAGEAAKAGLAEVHGPLMSAYLTTIAGFAPLLMVRGVVGDFLELLPIVTIFALVAAILVAYFLLPTLSVYLMGRPRKVITPPTNPDGSLMTEDQLAIANADALIAISPLKRAFGAVLEAALRHRMLVLAMTLVLTAVPIALFYIGAVGFEFMPDDDQPIVEVYFELPLGSSMEQKSVEVADKIEKAVAQIIRPDEWHRPSASADRVKPVTTIGDPGALNIRLDVSHGSGPEFGMVYIELSDADERVRTTKQIREAITQGLPPMPGVVVRVSSPTEGPPTEAAVVIRVMGHKETSYEALSERAEKVEELLRSIPGVFDVTNDYRKRPELVVTPNRAIASLFDIDAAAIATSVNYALEGVKVGDVDFGGDEKIELRLRNLASHRDKVTDLANLPLRSPTGKIVSLSEVASVDRKIAPNSIQHFDRHRSISIRCELMDGVLPDHVRAAMVAAMRPELSATQQHELVTNLSNRTIYSDDEAIVEFGGSNEIRNDAAKDIQLALTVSMGLMLIILVVQFNSFIEPAIVLFSVPLCLIGVTVGLVIFGLNFSIMAMIGIVALSGVVVDNAMVMIEFINDMCKQGVPLRKAVVYAGQFRVRPLILTTMTNVMGMLPAALNIGGGGLIWVPLSVTIIFGLGFATITQLILVPIMVYTFDFGSRGRRHDADAARPLDEPQLPAGDTATAPVAA